MMSNGLWCDDVMQCWAWGGSVMEWRSGALRVGSDARDLRKAAWRDKEWERERYLAYE